MAAFLKSLCIPVIFLALAMAAGCSNDHPSGTITDEGQKGQMDQMQKMMSTKAGSGGRPVPASPTK